MQFFLPSLNGGEISDLLAGRGDFKQRAYGGSTVENFIPLTQGPIIGRPGTKYISSVYNSNKRTHLIGLNSASGTSYVIEASEYVFRFYTSGALITGSTKALSSWGGNSSVTFTDAGDWVNWTNHGLPINASVKFATTLTLPTGITAGTTYYVYAAETDRFQITAAPEGEQLTFTGTGSGTMTCYHNIVTASVEIDFNENDLITISGATGAPTLINGTYAVKNISGIDSGDVIVNLGAQDNIEWTSHGLSADDPIIIRGSTIPGGLTNGNVYYVREVLTANTFTIAATKGGAEIALSSAGANVSVIPQTNYRRFELHSVNGSVDFLSGNKDMTTYTAAAGSPVAYFIGKMHPYQETGVLFDSNNRFDVGYAVLGDSVFFAHKDFWPRKLTVSSSTNWSFERHEHSSWTYTDGTIYPYFYDGPWVKSERDASVRTAHNGSAAVGGVGSIVSVAGDSVTRTTIFDPDDIGNIFRQEPDSGSIVKPAFFQITNYDSGSEVDIIRREDGGNANYHVGYRKGLFHSSIGYPNRISFYQDRACYSMMEDYPTRIEMSESGNYENFAPTDADDINEVLDSNAISFELPGDGTGKVQWAVGGGQSFVVGTEGNIFTISGTDSSVLSPGKLQSNAVSSYGSENVHPIQAGGGLYYIEKGGTRVRLAGSVSQDTFETMDVTRVNPNILDSGCLGMVFAKTPFSAAWMWRSDGQVVTLTIDEQEKVYAFARHKIGGTFSSGDAVVESVAVVNSSTYHNEVWMVVKRTINSSTVRYVERLSASLYADYTVTQSTAVCSDSAYVYSGGAVTNIPSGACNHLIGESVDVVADGLIVQGLTINGSGQLSSALSTAASSIIVGLAFRPKFETTDLQVYSEQGHTFGLRKRINECDIGFYRTLGAKVGRDSSNLQELDFGAYTSSVQSLFSGVKKKSLNGLHSESPRVRIEQLIPAPICITFLNAEGESYG